MGPKATKNREIPHQEFRWLIWLAVAFVVASFCALGLHAFCLMLQCGPPRDWMPLLAPFVTLGALIVGYYIWIDQTKLKRRFEVAERAMLALIAATDALEYARLDAYGLEYVADRPKDPTETPAEARIKDRWYACLKRLSERAKELNELREIELQCGLFLGAESREAVAEIARVARDVRTSASMLMMVARDYSERQYLPDDNRKKLETRVRQWEVACSSHLELLDDDGEWLPGSNKVNARIEEARDKLKRACAPYLITAEL